MKTALIGGGRGCLAVIDLHEEGELGILDMEVVAVVDVDPEAPAMKYATSRGWRTMSSIKEALALPDLELIVELTGSDLVLDEIYDHLPPRVRIMDHVMASVFWDLEKLAINRQDQLEEMARLEAQLEADRAELRRILDTIPDMVLVLDRDMRIRRTNRRFEEVTGLSREAAERFLYRQAFEMTESTDSPVDFVGPFFTAIETNLPVSVIQVHEDDAGRERFFQVAAHPNVDEDGTVIQVVQTAQEVTELVNLEREREEQGRRFRQIVDAVQGIITIKDLQGKFQLVNPRAEKLFGLKQSEMLGKTAEELFTPDTARVIHQNDLQIFEQRSHQINEEVLKLNGRERYLVIERFPLSDYKGDVVAVCCVARDVTRSRQLQNELVQSERLAAIGKLAAGVAHELNNPLTGILTFAEDLYLEADDDDPDKPDYEVIMNEAMRCRRIVRDLLDYSRQKTPERQRQTIGPIVQRAVTMVERQASFHNIQFDLSLDDAVLMVSIDASQIQQAILNLIINARDAMGGNGIITIRAGIRVKESAVFVEISDLGCGISKGDISEIFEPFYSTKGDRGNGLGLPAVRSLAEQHGGRIEVDSEIGRGSLFRLLLPAASN